MSVGSGLGASLGLAAEATYGTFVAPTRFLEFNKSDLKKGKKTVQGGGLAAGRFAQLGSRRVVTSTDATGTLDLEVSNKGFGLLLAHLLGSTATPVQQAATTAYLQTHTLGDNKGLSLTAQVGIPDLNGNVNPYSFTGGKVTDGTFACSVDKTLTFTGTFDFQGVDEGEALAAPSYVTGLAPFHFGQMTVKMGTYGAETSVDGVTGINVKVSRSQKTDRYYAGSATPATKAEPIMNNWVSVSGQIDADFLDKTVFADKFASDTAQSLVITWQGAVISGTYYEELTLTIPMIFFDGDTPVVDGPDVVSGSFPFTAQFDGTNALVTATYQSTDTTI